MRRKREITAADLRSAIESSGVLGHYLRCKLDVEAQMLMNTPEDDDLCRSVEVTSKALSQHLEKVDELRAKLAIEESLPVTVGEWVPTKGVRHV